MSETVRDIIREMREDWAITYFSEGTKKKNGDYSNVAAIGSQTVAERIESAHKREMLRMESLLQKAGETVVGLMNKASAQAEEIVRLRALVNDLDIALSGSLDIIGNVCEYIQADCGTMLRVETYREILAKAREAVR